MPGGFVSDDRLSSIPLSRTGSTTHHHGLIGSTAIRRMIDCKRLATYDVNGAGPILPPISQEPLALYYAELRKKFARGAEASYVPPPWGEAHTAA